MNNLLYKKYMQDIESKFSAFLYDWIQEQKRQKKYNQKELAALFGISPQHLSNIVNGRRYSTESWRRSVAQKIGVPYETMIGLEADDPNYQPFDNYDKIMKLPIVERGWAIMREAAKSQGITQYMSAEGGSDKPATLKKYLNGEETEEELYNKAVERFKEVAEKIEKLMKDGL